MAVLCVDATPSNATERCPLVRHPLPCSSLRLAAAAAAAAAGHGECNLGFCKCHEGWWGQDCSYRSHNTSWSPGECLSQAGWGKRRPLRSAAAAAEAEAQGARARVRKPLRERCGPTSLSPCLRPFELQGWRRRAGPGSRITCIAPPAKTQSPAPPASVPSSTCE